MRLKLALLSLLAVALTSCGSVGTVVLPANQPVLRGVYEGTITGVGGTVNGRLILGAVYEDGSFTAELSFPDDPQVVPAHGLGSVWGSSFSIMMDRFTTRPFYLEGHLDTATRRLIGTIRYPDREETLDFIFFYVRGVRD